MKLLESTTPKLNLGGTVRSFKATETLERLQPLLSSFGITRVANVTGLDTINIPVVLCVRPNGRCLSVSQGKGISLPLAKASAIMESIETYHAENLPSSEIRASYQEITSNYNALDPTVLNQGQQWSRYSQDTPLDWLSGFDLVTGEKVYVPRGYLCLDTTKVYRDRELFNTTSNGLASGNHLLEAIAHGLLEVIERDSDWRWSQLSDQLKIRTLVDNSTIQSPLLQSLLDHFEDAGVSVFLYNLTSDLGIPVYKCIIAEEENPYRTIGLCEGFGCHLAKEIAVSRAITEAAQSRLTMIAGSRDDMFASTYTTSEETSQISVSQFLAEFGNYAKLDFEQSPDFPSTMTFESDLWQLCQRLQEQSFEQVIVVNHTKAEFDIPVVHVIVPGMHQKLD